jgi:hypothetical protein
VAKAKPLRTKTPKAKLPKAKTYRTSQTRPNSTRFTWSTWFTRSMGFPWLKKATRKPKNESHGNSK